MDMLYFNGWVIIGLVIIPFAMFVVNTAKHRWTAALMFAGLCAFGVHIALATLATKDMIEDYRASIDEGALRALSGFASAPDWFFGSFVTAGLLCFAASAALWALGKLASRSSVQRDSKAADNDHLSNLGL